MPERLINHIDVLIHPEFDASTSSPVLKTGREELRKRWLDRASEISRDESSALFYFSGFLSFSRRPYVTRIYTDGHTELFEEDKERIKTIRGMLGDRFVLLAGRNSPDPYEIGRFIGKKGLKVDKNATVTAYGEYLDSCVQTWGEVAATAVGIPHENIVFSAELSLDSEGNVAGLT